MKLHVVGELLGDSGYAVHTRQLLTALRKEGVEIALTCNKPADWVRHVSDDELKMCNNNPNDADALLLITLPTLAPFYWNVNIPILQYCVFEGDKIPKYWLEILGNDKITNILVPSNHTKSAILTTISECYTNANDESEYPASIANKISVVNHGVDLTLFQPSNTSNNSVLTFLCDKGWTNKGSKDRGGVSFLVKAFSEEFTSKDKVRLIVKVNAAYGFDKPTLDRNMAELKILNKDTPRIDVIPGNMPFNKLPEMYNSCDVFVISSLAESFHMGGLQAMACSKPVLTTPFGGMMDYCNESNSWILDEGEMIKMSNDQMYEEIQWQLPDITKFRSKLRFIYNNQFDIKIKGNNALQTVQSMTWSHSAKTILKLLNKE